MREKMGIMVHYNVKVRCVVAFGRYIQSVVHVYVHMGACLGSICTASAAT